MSSRRRRRRRHHRRRIGKKMSSFRRRRRRLPPPQEHVRIRRGCNKSHLFLCLSPSLLAQRTQRKLSLFIYIYIYTRAPPSRVRVFVCGCRVQFYLFLSDVFAPKKPQQKLWSFLASRRTRRTNTFFKKE